MPYRYLYRSAVVAAATVSVLLPGASAQGADPPRYETYYSTFTRGAQQIPWLDTTPYVPQGLAHLPELDALVVSYYDDGGGNARAAIVDTATSALIKTVVFDDVGHVQALATSARHLWLATTSGGNKKIVRYRRSDIVAAAPGAQIRRDKDYVLAANSFVEIFGNKMYVGTYVVDDNGRAYRYTLNAAEDPVYDNYSFDIPSNVQGLAVTPTHFIWSRSNGRDNDSSIATNRHGEALLRTITAPNMSEDLAIADGRVFVVYESAALKYSDADYQVRTIHRAQLSALIP
ncbi:MAG TPA: hypothetical protein VF657_15065 [Actinoplanes sp.]|jgi:hypothetical protein